MIVRLLKTALRRFIDDDMLSYSAAVTYHVLFSSLPFAIFLIALIGYLDLDPVFDWLRAQAKIYFLEDTVPQINQIIDQLQQRRVGMLSAGVAASLWASSSAMRSMMKALNAVYRVKEERPLVKRWVLSIIYTLGLGLLGTVVLAMVVVSPRAIQMLAQHWGVERSTAILWAWWLRWPTVVVLLGVIIAILYGVAPDVEQRIRFVSPGAFAVVVLWLAASWAFNYYVRTVAGYDRLYGTVGTAIVLPLYVYLTSIIFLLGAELNAVAEYQSPAGKDPGEKELE
ncbi:YihY/virulence factor BrkB family protein [Oxalobacteraceae bacterium OM1]|nr:YihY/virulence factor BrkB family protein [Oxalobacteraceae bacterium OM1]